MSLKSSLLFISLLVLCECELISLDKIYRNGVEAYSRQDWSECVIQFEDSLNLYKLYKAIIINCKHKCKTFSYEHVIKEDLEDLKMYEKFFLVNNCLIACENTEFEKTSLKNRIPNSLLSKMMDLKPYEYLHICYYQIHQLEKAASAAATYLIAHPDNEVMRSNLEQYLKMSKVRTDELVNFEAEKYMMLYDKALVSYRNKDWSQTIDYMESAIKYYIISEDNCRAECEQLPEHEWDTEFMATVSKAISLLLSCRQHCQSRLKSIDYNSGLDYLSDALDYLQISYYNTDKYEQAAQATETYLALKPDDQNMLDNKNVYRSLTDENSFVERSDIMYYLKRDVYEKNLLKLYLEEYSDLYNTNNIL